MAGPVCAGPSWHSPRQCYKPRNDRPKTPRRRPRAFPETKSTHSRRASAHAGHDPPQSAPASSPFWVPSEHVGPGMWPASEWQRSSGSDTLEFVQSGRHDPARHDRQPRDPTRSDPTRPDTTLRSAITVAGRRVAVFGVAHREQRTPPGNQPVAKQGSEDQKTTDQTHAPRP